MEFPLWNEGIVFSLFKLYCGCELNITSKQLLIPWNELQGISLELWNFPREIKYNLHQNTYSPMEFPLFSIQTPSSYFSLIPEVVKPTYFICSSYFQFKLYSVSRCHLMLFILFLMASLKKSGHMVLELLSTICGSTLRGYWS